MGRPARRRPHRAGDLPADRSTCPARRIIFDTVFVLVVVFTIVQGWSLPWVARRLRIAAPITPRDVEVESAPLDELDADLMQLTVPPGLPAARRLPARAAAARGRRRRPGRARRAVLRARRHHPAACAGTRPCWCRPAARGPRPSGGCGRSAAPAGWPAGAARPARRASSTEGPRRRPPPSWHRWSWGGRRRPRRPGARHAVPLPPPGRRGRGAARPALGPAAGGVGPEPAARGPAARHLAARRPVRRDRTGTSSRSRRSTSGWPGTSTRCSASSRRRGCRRSPSSGICVDRPRRPGGDPGHPLPRVLDVLPLPVLQPAGATTRPSGCIDTMVELLVRLHLAGVFWGDCSLSNTLFRPDAGALAAYLVDAETAERHAALSPGQRAYDVDLARERVGAELMDLQFGGLLPDGHRPDRDRRRACPSATRRCGRRSPARRSSGLDEQRYRVAERLQPAQRPGVRRRRGRADHLAGGRPAAGRHPGRRARPAPPRARSGSPAWRCRRSQARRLLNDLRTFRAWLEQRDGRPGAGDRRRRTAGSPRSTSRSSTRSRPDLAGRLAPAEVFHEVLEHRWFLSEQARRDVGTTEAARVLLRAPCCRGPRRRSPPRR